MHVIGDADIMSSAGEREKATGVRARARTRTSFIALRSSVCLSTKEKHVTALNSCVEQAVTRHAERKINGMEGV
jgi:hypothetical protein